MNPYNPYSDPAYGSRGGPAGPPPNFNHPGNNARVPQPFFPPGQVGPPPPEGMPRLLPHSLLASSVHLGGHQPPPGPPQPVFVPNHRVAQPGNPHHVRSRERAHSDFSPFDRSRSRSAALALFSDEKFNRIRNEIKVQARSVHLGEFGIPGYTALYQLMGLHEDAFEEDVAEHSDVAYRVLQGTRFLMHHCNIIEGHHICAGDVDWMHANILLETENVLHQLGNLGKDLKPVPSCLEAIGYAVNKRNSAANPGESFQIQTARDSHLRETVFGDKGIIKRVFGGSWPLGPRKYSDVGDIHAPVGATFDRRGEWLPQIENIARDKELRQQATATSFRPSLADTEKKLGIIFRELEHGLQQLSL